MSECMCPVDRYGDVDSNRRVCQKHKNTVWCILCDGQCPACDAEYQQLEVAILNSDEGDHEAFELQLDEYARRLFSNLAEGEGQHSEALDIALIKASFRQVLKWAR